MSAFEDDVTMFSLLEENEKLMKENRLLWEEVNFYRRNCHDSGIDLNPLVLLGVLPPSRPIPSYYRTAESASLQFDFLPAIASQAGLAIASNTILKSLSIRAKYFGSGESFGDIADGLAINTTLTKLNLGIRPGQTSEPIDSRLAPYVASVIDRNTTLLHLDLRSNKLDEQAMAVLGPALARNTTLVTIHLDGNPLGNGMQHLGHALSVNTHLKNIDVGMLKGNFAPLFRGLIVNPSSALKKLSCCFPDGMADEYAPLLEDLLTVNTSLQTLSFVLPADENQSTALAGGIARGLSKNTTLLTLSIDELGPSEEASLLVVDGLLANHALTSLSLGQNQSATLGRLGATLRSNTSLLALTLRPPCTRCEDLTLSSQGLMQLAAGLATNSHLTTLSLKSFHMNEEAQATLAKALLSNSTLSDLNLDGCNISSKTLVILAGVLKSTALKVLNLEFTWVDDAALIALAEAIQVNSTLQTLRMAESRADFSKDALLKFASAMEANTSITDSDFDDGTDRTAELPKRPIQMISSAIYRNRCNQKHPRTFHSSVYDWNADY